MRRLFLACSFNISDEVCRSVRNCCSVTYGFKVTWNHVGVLMSFLCSDLDRNPLGTSAKNWEVGWPNGQAYIEYFKLVLNDPRRECQSRLLSSGSWVRLVNLLWHIVENTWLQIWRAACHGLTPLLGKRQSHDNNTSESRHAIETGGNFQLESQ